MREYRVVDNADGWAVYLMPSPGVQGKFIETFSKKEWTREQIERICELLNKR